MMANYVFLIAIFSIFVFGLWSQYTIRKKHNGMKAKKDKVESSSDEIYKTKDTYYKYDD